MFQNRFKTLSKQEYLSLKYTYISLFTFKAFRLFNMIDELVVLGLTALCDTISVYIGPFPREGEEK